MAMVTRQFSVVLTRPTHLAQPIKSSLSKSELCNLQKKTNDFEMDRLSTVEPTSILHLPDDCLSLVYSQLDCNLDRESFGLTCHWWLKIENANRQSLQFHRFRDSESVSRALTGIEVTLNYLYRLLTRFRNLRYLYFSGLEQLPDIALTYLHHCGSKLHTLKLDGCRRITDEGLSVVATSCRSLEVISLQNCYSITDIGLERLAKSCLELKHVNLACCVEISDHGIKALSQACRKLVAVEISFCRDDVTGIGFNGCSSTLTRIGMQDCRRITSEGIMGILSGGGIEYLNLSVGIMRSPGFGNVYAGIGSGFGSRIKILNLKACEVVDESVVAIAKGCPLLEEWNLTSCYLVGLSGWESIGSNCNNLRKLYVSWCRNFCDLGLQALRHGCKKLSVLYIGQISSLSPIAIELFKLQRGDVDINVE